jgi:hypothetical protein
MPLIAIARAPVSTIEGLEFQMTGGNYHVPVFVNMDALQDLPVTPFAAGPLEKFRR